MIDFWTEIYENIRCRSRQTIASCVGISWGIFIMIVLVGIGNSFQDSIENLFENFNSNRVEVYAGIISKPTHGGVEGARIRFDKNDISNLKLTIPDIEYISPVFSTLATISSLGHYDRFEVRGFDEDYLKMQENIILRGRNLNKRDFEEGRKCAIIGEDVEKILFRNKDCINKRIIINNMVLQVVGVFQNTPTTPNDARAVLTTSANYISIVDLMPQFTTLVYTSRSNRDIKEQIKKSLGATHHFKPSDEKAIYIITLEEQLSAFDKLFGGIRYFLWFVGVITLVGGVIGISNIMVSNVRERTCEIGVRMAVGATQNDIKKLIVGESIAITIVAGVCGIFLGWLVLQLIAQLMIDELVSPSIDLVTTIFSMIIIFISGLISGLRPAYVASSMNLISALQSE